MHPIRFYFLHYKRLLSERLTNVIYILLMGKHFIEEEKYLESRIASLERTISWHSYAEAYWGAKGITAYLNMMELIKPPSIKNLMEVPMSEDFDV